MPSICWQVCRRTGNVEVVARKRTEQTENQVGTHTNTAANHLKLANAAEKQRNFHQAQAQAILTQFYAELTSARQNGMSPAQWHKIVNLRAQYVGQRNAETDQHYYYLVQYSHYVLFKYRFTW